VIEDEKPEDKKPELTRRCKVEFLLFDAKVISLVMFAFSAGLHAVYHDGNIGLWGEWYVLGPLIVLWMVAPLRKPDKEYKK